MAAARSSGPAADLAILGAGIASEVIALAGVRALTRWDPELDLMGLYAALVIPAGAILVGALAGSGFGLASWRIGRKVGGGLIGLVLALQVAAYAGAQWIQFAEAQPFYDDGTPVPFLVYFDFVTRTMTLTIGHSDQPTAALGAWGYAFRLLELVGFASGGLIAPIALRAKPYCEACGRYMRTRSLFLAPASVPARKLKKGDLVGAETQRQAEQTAQGAGLETVQAALHAAESGDAAALRALADRHAPGRKAAGKLPHRVDVSLSECASCREGLLVARSIAGQGQQMRVQEIGRRPAAAAFVRALSG